MAVNTMASYLPMDRSQAIARGAALPDRLQGAALFADVSGFTKLTELLVAQHGLRRGAEELTARLNRVYEVLIGEVDRFGGSVIGFSGDAITCWFDSGPARGEADDLERAACRAITSAARMRAGLADLGDDHGDGVVLGVKVAIATGPVRRFVVGDPSVQLLDVLAGETLVRMAACERLAALGEIVVDEQTVTIAPSSCGDCEWRQGGDAGPNVAVLRSTPVEADLEPWPDLAPDALPEDMLRRWLLPGVNPGHGEFVTELRPTVPMLIGFEGIDFDGDSRAGTKLDGFVRWVQQVVTRFEASLLDITIGDKGSYVYASFGAPVAHDDDAGRAAAAALELRRPPGELDFVREVRIGISQGTTRAGIVGGGSRCTYAVLGEEVNLAARLMQHAEPAGVLASGRVQDRLGEGFVSEQLPDVQLKGKRELVPVYRLEAAREVGPQPRRAPLVGRVEEWTVFEEALDRLANGERSVVVVEGEAGIGKTRLVRELRASANDRGAASLVGWGDPVGQATLFHGWRPVFRAIFGMEDVASGNGDTAAAAVLERVVDLTGDDEAAAFAPLLAPVLPVSLPDTEATAGLSGQVRANRRLDLMVDVLRGVAARGPSLLVLEDAHWLDTASWALVQRVATEVEPLLFVCATRPPESPAPELSGLLADPSTTRMVLDPLGEDDVHEIVRQRLGVEAVPAEVGSFITDRAEGNPFFSEELASALQERGIVSIVEGICELTATPAELRALDVPDTVQGVITGRIDRLTDPQKLAIKFASVIGRTFRLRTLQEIHPVSEYVPQLHDDVNHLAEIDLTPSLPLEPELTFIFKHAITQDVAYNMLLFTQRAQLHAAIAGWFELMHAANLAPYYATLAHHWRRALDRGEAPDPEAVERALDYGVKAGQQGLRNSAHVEATEEFRQVIDLLRTIPAGPERDARELFAQSMLGYALMNQRGYGDAEVEAAYRRARELSEGEGRVRSAELGPPLYGLLSYYASRGEYGPAAEVADELLALGDQLDDPQLRLIGHNSIGLVAILRGDLETGREHTEQSHRLADAHQDQELMLRYGGDFRGYPRAWLSTAQCLLGYPDQAQRTFEETLELTRDHPYTFGFMLTFGIAPILRADLERTLDCAEQLTEVSQKYGFALLTLVANIHRGWALALHGEPEGVALIAGSLPVIKAVKLDSFVPMYLGLCAEAQLATGAIDDAEATLDEADAYVETAGGSFYAAELARLRGRLRALGGATEAAAQSFEQAITIARRQGARWWELRAAVGLAQLGDGEAAPDARAELSRILETFDEGVDSPDLVEARALLSRSSHESATKEG